MIIINVSILKNKDGNNHILNNKGNFYLNKDYIDLKVSEYYGYLNDFDNLKPIDDYSWIGLKMEESSAFNIPLIFEIDVNIDLDLIYFFLKLIIFKTSSAKSIYLR